MSWKLESPGPHALAELRRLGPIETLIAGTALVYSATVRGLRLLDWF
jgi:hypothetical protein